MDRVYGTCGAFLLYLGFFSESDANFVITAAPVMVRVSGRKVGGTDSSWRSSTAAYYAVYPPFGPFLCR